MTWYGGDQSIVYTSIKCQDIYLIFIWNFWWGFNYEQKVSSLSLGKVDPLASPSQKKQILQPHPTQPVITCSKLTIETLEQGVKHVQS